MKALLLAGCSHGNTMKYHIDHIGWDHRNESSKTTYKESFPRASIRRSQAPPNGAGILSESFIWQSRGTWEYCWKLHIRSGRVRQPCSKHPIDMTWSWSNWSNWSSCLLPWYHSLFPLLRAGKNRAIRYHHIVVCKNTLASKVLMKCTPTITLLGEWSKSP